MIRKAPCMFILLIAGLLSFSGSLAAQDFKIKKTRGGIISLGTRSTISAFNDGKWKDVGTGLGGQTRIQFSNRVNTDWMMDYITGNIGTVAHRTDLHIGWSVLYYLKNYDVAHLPKLQPFVLAGHCFDHSLQQDNLDYKNQAERWSAAAQGGLGCHINLTQQLDLTPMLQYMLHLGTDIRTSVVNNKVVFERFKGANLEGHLLFNVSVNYKIIDAW